MNKLNWILALAVYLVAAGESIALGCNFVIAAPCDLDLFESMSLSQWLSLARWLGRQPCDSRKGNAPVGRARAPRAGRAM